MNTWLLVAVVAFAFAVVAGLLLIVVGLIAAPRKVTSGPLVGIARGLFLIACGCLIVSLFAAAGGAVSAWV